MLPHCFVQFPLPQIVEVLPLDVGTNKGLVVRAVCA